eukprot:scaffold15696_cov113-Isochrysis_galbana.AAC.8
MESVSMVWTSCTTPLSSRNPTTILGTPARNDCNQNLSSLCFSNEVRSRCSRISLLVFSSTYRRSPCVTSSQSHSAAMKMTVSASFSRRIAQNSSFAFTTRAVASACCVWADPRPCD